MGMLYILKLVCLQWKERVCCTFGITKFAFGALHTVNH